MLPLGDPAHAPAHASDQARTSTDPAELLATWVAETAGGTDDLKPRLLRLADGHLVPLDVARWSGPVDAADESLLARTAGAVLDVGCGPGRLTAALHRRGVDVLGLELVPSLPVLARAAGAPVVLGDVFGSVPRTGEWDTVLLADGNVGIGGDAAVLLRRAASLVHPTGRVLVELSPGGQPASGPVRLEGLGCTSAWFRWALLGRA
ncbi:MAG: Methyltransferase type 12, partial [Frankiales bacterium]|nr:Methyltransferase type 12 [Frankiales bacterium]